MFDRRLCNLGQFRIPRIVYTENLNKLDSKYEPLHDKTNKMTVRPAKTQIILFVLLCTRSAFHEGVLYRTRS